jgi:phospholipid-translocating ATPase
MGIVMRDTVSGEFSFLQKGADIIMAKIVQHNDWPEEMANMACKGLRTLVVTHRKLVRGLQSAAPRCERACRGRNEAMAVVVTETLERDLELLGPPGRQVVSFFWCGSCRCYVMYCTDHA